MLFLTALNKITAILLLQRRICFREANDVKYLIFIFGGKIMGDFNKPPPSRPWVSFFFFFLEKAAAEPDRTLVSLLETVPDPAMHPLQPARIPPFVDVFESRLRDRLLPDLLERPRQNLFCLQSGRSGFGRREQRRRNGLRRLNRGLKVGGSNPCRSPA